MSEQLKGEKTTEFGVTAENKTATQVLCTFLISNKACEVKCAKPHTPKMHSSKGHDTGQEQDINTYDIWRINQKEGDT